MKTIRISSGKTETSDGRTEYSYVARAGSSLYKLLETDSDVEVSAMGRTAVSNAVKAVVHASQIASQHGRIITADKFAYRNTKLTGMNGEELDAVITTFVVHLI